MYETKYSENILYSYKNIKQEKKINWKYNTKEIEVTIRK